jgi:hypothetical protein
MGGLSRPPFLFLDVAYADCPRYEPVFKKRHKTVYIFAGSGWRKGCRTAFDHLPFAFPAIMSIPYSARMNIP